MRPALISTSVRACRRRPVTLAALVLAAGAASCPAVPASAAPAEPPLNTPFPTYYALAMLSKLGLPGDTMVRAGTDQQLVAAHAVRNANGDLSVMLVNKDPANSYQVALHYAGFTPAAATPTVYTYGDEAASITSAAQPAASSQVLPPYSIETIVLKPQARRARCPRRAHRRPATSPAPRRPFPGPRRSAGSRSGTRSTGSSAPTANRSAAPPQAPSP